VGGRVRGPSAQRLPGPGGSADRCSITPAHGSGDAPDDARAARAHDALADCWMSFHILQAAMQAYQWTYDDLYHRPELTLRRITTMPFGKHKGKPLSMVPDDYVNWLLKQDNVDPSLRAAFRAIQLAEERDD
jgi:exodeoxyribonuclease X